MSASLLQQTSSRSSSCSTLMGDVDNDSDFSDETLRHNNHHSINNHVSGDGGDSENTTVVASSSSLSNGVADNTSSNQLQEEVDKLKGMAFYIFIEFGLIYVCFNDLCCCLYGLDNTRLNCV